MKIVFKKSTDLRPENVSELKALSKKWRISLNELCRAIVETGTTNTKDLKAHIKKGKAHLNQHYGFKRFYSGLYIVGRD
jgi:hypothetical protein